MPLWNQKDKEGKEFVVWVSFVYSSFFLERVKDDDIRKTLKGIIWIVVLMPRFKCRRVSGLPRRPAACSWWKKVYLRLEHDPANTLLRYVLLDRNAKSFHKVAG